MNVFLGGKEDLDFLTETTKASGKEAQGTFKMVSGRAEFSNA